MARCFGVRASHRLSARSFSSSNIREAEMNFSFNKLAATRLNFENAVDKVKAARSTTYTVTSADVSSKYTAAVSLTWDAPFADTNYTVALDVEGVSLSSPTKDGYAPARFTKTVNGLSVVLSAPNGTAGDTLVVHAFAIHD